LCIKNKKGVTFIKNRLIFGSMHEYIRKIALAALVTCGLTAGISTFSRASIPEPLLSDINRYKPDVAFITYMDDKVKFAHGVEVEKHIASMQTPTNIQFGIEELDLGTLENIAMNLETDAIKDNGRTLHQYKLLQHPNNAGIHDKITRTLQYAPIIKMESFQYGIPADLYAALIAVESGGNPDANSGTGARGLTQLLEGTAHAMSKNPRKFNVDSDCSYRYDPHVSIQCGAAFFAKVKNRIDTIYSRLPASDRTDLALASYNAGVGGIKHAMRGRKTFWHIPQKKAPAQSYKYVPKIRAVQKLIHSNPAYVDKLRYLFEENRM